MPSRYVGSYTFKFQITPDRHKARQKLTYCLLPDPPHFSLPSTFKAVSVLICNCSKHEKIIYHIKYIYKIDFEFLAIQQILGTIVTSVLKKGNHCTVE